MLALVFRRFVPGSSFLDPCFGRFLGMLILVPGRFLKRFIPGFSFLNIAGRGVAGRGVARSGTGGFRLTRLLQIMASELWLAR